MFEYVGSNITLYLRVNSIFEEKEKGKVWFRGQDLDVARRGDNTEEWLLYIDYEIEEFQNNVTVGTTLLIQGQPYVIFQNDSIPYIQHSPVSIKVDQYHTVENPEEILSQAPMINVWAYLNRFTDQLVVHKHEDSINFWVYETRDDEGVNYEWLVTAYGEIADDVDHLHLEMGDFIHVNGTLTLGPKASEGQSEYRLTAKEITLLASKHPDKINDVDEDDDEPPQTGTLCQTKNEGKTKEGDPKFRYPESVLRVINNVAAPTISAAVATTAYQQFGADWFKEKALPILKDYRDYDVILHKYEEMGEDDDPMQLLDFTGLMFLLNPYRTENGNFINLSGFMDILKPAFHLNDKSANRITFIRKIRNMCSHPAKDLEDQEDRNGDLEKRYINQISSALRPIAPRINQKIAQYLKELDEIVSSGDIFKDQTSLRAITLRCRTHLRGDLPECVNAPIVKPMNLEKESAPWAGAPEKGQMLVKLLCTWLNVTEDKLDATVKNAYERIVQQEVIGWFYQQANHRFQITGAMINSSNIAFIQGVKYCIKGAGGSAKKSFEVGGENPFCKEAVRQMVLDEKGKYHLSFKDFPFSPGVNSAQEQTVLQNEIRAAAFEAAEKVDPQYIKDLNDFKNIYHLAKEGKVDSFNGFLRFATGSLTFLPWNQIDNYLKQTYVSEFADDVHFSKAFEAVLAKFVTWKGAYITMIAELIRENSGAQPVSNRLRNINSNISPREQAEIGKQGSIHFVETLTTTDSVDQVMKNANECRARAKRFSQGSPTQFNKRKNEDERTDAGNAFVLFEEAMGKGNLDAACLVSEYAQMPGFTKLTGHRLMEGDANNLALMKVAALCGHSYAMYKVGMFYEKRKANEIANRCYAKAAEWGYDKAINVCKTLGIQYKG